MNNEISRRQFIIGAGAAAVLPFIDTKSVFGEQQRPNFVFILTDDQRWDSMSCVGNKDVFTPNIDRIAKEGAIFANAFVTTSLCSPSRASFLTGRYAHAHGVIDNQTIFDQSVPTFPLTLRNAGYKTAFIGKWHMTTQEGPIVGFDKWISFQGQGVYYDPELNIDGKKQKVNGYITDLLTNYSLDWLKEQKNSPFCLYLSHKALHSDFYPAVRHLNLYSGLKLKAPESMFESEEDKPAWVKQVRRKWDDPENEKTYQDRAKDYYRCLAAVDDSVGRVLDELENLGVLDNTVVVFAGDNGFFLGEHGLGDKRAMYEESIRIPFLMRYPKMIRPGSVINQMVLNIDLCPTFCDLANVKAPEGVEGMSMRPILKGGNPKWREDWLYEYNWEAEAKRRPGIRGVRTDRWKYITYMDKENISELYDLKNDPQEMHNIINDPKYKNVLEDMKSRLQKYLAMEKAHTK